MKERVYQGTIGGLLIVASFAFYNLYKKEDISKEKEKVTFDLNKSTDIRALKQNYTNSNSSEVLSNQYQKKNNIALNSRLTELDKSTQKSIEWRWSS